MKENKDDAFVFFEKTSLLSDDENDESYQYYEKYIEDFEVK